MRLIYSWCAIFTSLLLTTTVFGHGVDLDSYDGPVRAILGEDLLKALNVPARTVNKEIGVAIADLPVGKLEELSELAHKKFNRCGGFEVLDPAPENSFMDPDAFLLDDLASQVQSEKDFKNQNFFFQNTPRSRPWIADALDGVSAQRVGADIEWLSSYHTRHHKSDKKNLHVNDLKTKLEALVEESNYAFPVIVDLIEHKRTAQRSVRAYIEGKDADQARVILGGHLDSIRSFGLANWRSPGADDNASGSSSLIEAFRILLEQGQPSRTVEFFWYAGEEAGLLGSSEIAKSYKADEIEVYAALQLDMTGQPGSGENTINFISDYTTSWLNQYLKDLNELYIGARVIESACGYACSDHASWFRQSYSVSFPFEASFADYSKLIHTKNDLIKNGVSFEHSALFAKLAAAFMLDLAYE